jgi:hypothetical protein
MASDVVLEIDGLKKLTRRLDKIADLSYVRATLEGAAIQIADRMKEYPPERHAPQPFASDKQRRGFFWHLKQGDIEVPYRRGQSPSSESLKHRWTVKLEDEGLTATIGNNASYARLVQDSDKQTRYHAATGWPTVQGVAEEERTAVIEAITAAVKKSLVE